jgi:hypothetical protein
MVCARCGALVEFRVNQNVEATCASGHRVTNQMANLFRSDRSKGKSSRAAGVRTP